MRPSRGHSARQTLRLYELLMLSRKIIDMKFAIRLRLRMCSVHPAPYSSVGARTTKKTKGIKEDV